MRNWLKEPRTTKAEAEILTLESQVGITSSGGPPALDQNTLITSYVGASEMKGGGTPATELRNLQIQFDTQLMHALSISDKNEWSPSTELLRSLIDDRTVLLVQFLGSDLQGQAILMTLLISKETEFATYGTYSILGSATVILGSGEEKTRASMLSFRVRDLRECLCRPPGPRAADSRALDEMYVRDLHHRMFDNVWKWAGTYRQTERNIGCDPRMHGILQREIVQRIPQLLAPTRDTAWRTRPSRPTKRCFVFITS